jgi:hypothetical protein
MVTITLCCEGSSADDVAHALDASCRNRIVSINTNTLSVRTGGGDVGVAGVANNDAGLRAASDTTHTKRVTCAAAAQLCTASTTVRAHFGLTTPIVVTHAARLLRREQRPQRERHRRPRRVRVPKQLPRHLSHQT